MGSPRARARRAAALIDDDGTEIGMSLVALAECAHVLRTQYGIEQRESARSSYRRCTMIVASTVAADALPFATFDGDQRRYGIAVREP